MKKRKKTIDKEKIKELIEEVYFTGRIDAINPRFKSLDAQVKRFNEIVNSRLILILQELTPTNQKEG